MSHAFTFLPNLSSRRILSSLCPWLPRISRLNAQNPCRGHFECYGRFCSNYCDTTCRLNTSSRFSSCACLLRSLLGTIRRRFCSSERASKQYDCLYPTFARRLQARFRLGGLCETDHSLVSLMFARLDHR